MRILLVNEFTDQTEVAEVASLSPLRVRWHNVLYSCDDHGRLDVGGWVIATQDLQIIRKVSRRAL
jgi:hypothetical protein